MSAPHWGWVTPANFIEELALRWLRELLGLPETYGGAPGNGVPSIRVARGGGDDIPTRRGSGRPGEDAAHRRRIPPCSHLGRSARPSFLRPSAALGRLASGRSDPRGPRHSLDQRRANWTLAAKNR